MGVLHKGFCFVIRLTELKKWSGCKIKLIIIVITLKYFFFKL